MSEFELVGTTTADDPTVALQAASLLMSDGFGKLAGCTDAGAIAGAQRVTIVADVFVAWLRQVKTLSITLVAIEDISTGAPVADPLPRGANMAVELKTNQRARYTIEARDARGFLNKEALDLLVTSGVDGITDVTAEIITTPDPTQPNELLVTAVTLGVGTSVTLDVPNDDTVAPASDSFNVRAGDVAVLTLGAPVIEDIPAL